jgi:hypothetical protein
MNEWMNLKFTFHGSVEQFKLITKEAKTAIIRMA